MVIGSGVEVSPEILQIATNYQVVVGALDLMFKEADLRLKQVLWREEDSIHKNVGTCRDMYREDSEWDLIGPARSYLIRLRDQRNREVPGRATLTHCPYHRRETGCVLRGLKSPACIGYIDYPGEFQERFRVDVPSLKRENSRALECILENQGPDGQGIDEFVQDTLGVVKQLTEHIKKHPILS